MSELNDKLIDILDVPVWENLRPGYNSGIAGTCFIKDIVNKKIYHIYSSTDFFVYDCETDGWTRLASDSIMQNFSTTIAGTYTQHAGHFSQAISATTNTISGSFLLGYPAIGCKINIIRGTGAGQTRIITSVSDPIVADTIGCTTGASTYITDTNKASQWSSQYVNNWVGYQVRTISGTGLSQVRPIFVSNNVAFLFAGSNIDIMPLESLPFITSTSSTAPATYSVIEYQIATVDKNWDIQPDNTSIYEVESGAVWILNSFSVAPFSALIKYNVLGNYWKIKTGPRGYIEATLATDWCLEAIHKHHLEDPYETGTSESGTVTTLVDSNATFVANKYTNCRIKIISGTGAGQERTILSNTTTAITTCIPFDTAPSSDSVYEIWPDYDKIYFMTASPAYNMLMQYSIEHDIWTCSKIRDRGTLNNMGLKSDGEIVYPAADNNLTRSGSTASFSSYYSSGVWNSIIPGHSITVTGVSQIEYNGQFTSLNTSDIAAIKYTISGTPDTPATPANDFAPIYYNQVVVSGSLTPDATGVYTVAGTYNGKPYYQRGSDSWYIWWNSSANCWEITTVLGGDYGTRWASTLLIGGLNSYNPLDSTGSATVANITTTYYNTITVTGSLTPDATGTYTVKGLYNGAPYYQRGSDSWYVFSGGSIGYWIIATAFGDPADRWQRAITSAGNLDGDYSAGGGTYTGTATIASTTTSGIYSFGIYQYPIVVDSTKNWTVNEHVGRYFYYTTSTTGYAYLITSNTATTLSINSTSTTPLNNASGKYIICDNHPFGASLAGLNWYNQVNITGSLTPDASGIYTASGTYNGKPYYQRGTRYLYYESSNLRWVLYNCPAGIPNWDGLERWVNGIPQIDSNYSPFSGAVGTATVSIKFDSGIYQTDALTLVATGTQTNTTLQDTTKNWKVGELSGKVIKIIAGMGPVLHNLNTGRVVSSNTSNTITLVTTWPSGNNPVDTQTSYVVYDLSYGSAAYNAGAGMSLNWIYNLDDPANPDNSFRYIYHFRGNGTNLLYRYDLQNETWEPVKYTPDGEPLTTGAMVTYDGDNRLYISTGTAATYKLISLDLVEKNMETYTQQKYAQGTLALGNRSCVIADSEGNKYYYRQDHSLNTMQRILIP